MARRQNQFRQSSSRPNRAWAGAAPAISTVVPAASKVLLSTVVLSNQGIDETILRVVGSVSILSDQVASSELQYGAVGMCLVTDTAAAAGIASIPDPVTDVQDDVWFFYQGFSQEFIVLTAVGSEPHFVTTYAFDSKAKRIFHLGSTVAVVAANAHATHGFAVALNFRLLSMVRGTR